jgi:hypothetical protein
MTSKMIENPSRRSALGVLAAAALGGCATQAVSQAEPERLVADAQRTLSNFIRDPDQTWIQDNLSRARGSPDRAAGRQGGLHFRWLGGARRSRCA